MVEMSTIEDFVDAIKEPPQDDIKTYVAEVSRIDDEGVVWVRMSGAEKETPTASTSAEVKRGDIVNVEWRNNKLYIAGNATNPSAGVIRVEAVEQAAEVAREAAANAVQSAGEAHAAAEDAKATAESVHGIAVQASEDAEAAKTAAGTAQTAADTALVNLATTEDVVGVLNWITAHGTMVSQTGGVYVDGQVYFVADPTGDYVVSGTHYSVVAEPKAEDIDTYYVLNISESVQNYVATHIVVDTEGLWIVPDNGGNKVLIATGSGSTYTTAGTYIVGTGGVTLASFTANEAIIGQESEAHAVVNSESMSLILGNGFAPFSVNSGATTSAPKVYKRSFTLSPNGTYTLTLPDTTIVSGSNIHLYVTVTQSGSTSVKNMNFTHGTSSSQSFGGLGVTYNGARVFQFTESGSSVNWAIETTFTYEISNGTGAYYNIGFRNVSNSIGEFSVAEGYNTTASGDYSHAEGYETTADGSYSHAEGNDTNADNGGHAEGLYSSATGSYSHAEGASCGAYGDNAHAEGGSSQAYGNNAHAQNLGTYASSDNQTAIGKFNVIDNSDTYAAIVGNGTSDSARSNAATLDWSGNTDQQGRATTADMTAQEISDFINTVPTGFDNLTNLSVTNHLAAGGDVTAGGDITVQGHSSPIGTIKDAYNSSAVSIPTSTGTAVTSISLEEGTWLITFGGRFSTNANGERRVCISQTSGASDMNINAAPVSGANTQIVRNTIVQIFATTTYYLNLYQTSGSTLSAPASGTNYGNFIRAIRIL